MLSRREKNVTLVRMKAAASTCQCTWGPALASLRSWDLVPRHCNQEQFSSLPAWAFCTKRGLAGVETETPRGCRIFLEKQTNGRIQKHSRDAQIQPRLGLSTHILF